MNEYAMMPKNDYANICNAVREKSGETKLYKSGEIANSILQIASDKAYSENDDVCFWDYDGTLIYSCSLAEAHTMTELPAPPDHSGDDIPLTFSEWNHTLEEVNNLKVGGDIGALYSPIDEKTHFTVRITKTTGLIVTVHWRWSNGKVIVDWGDGSEDVFAAASVGADATHEYSDYGEYQCTIYSEAGYNLGGSGSCVFLDDNKMLIGKFVMGKHTNWVWPGAQGERCFASSNIETFVFNPDVTGITGSGVLSGCCKLKHLNLPHGLKAIPHNTIMGCYSIKHISISGSLTTTGEYAFSGSNIERIILPDTVTARGRFTVLGCRLLKKIKLPSETTSITFREIKECYSLKEILIPESVTSLAGEDFMSTGITDYYFYPSTPPVMPVVSTFSGIHSSAIIHVPEASLELYQTATNWVTYADYMVGDL